MPRQSIVDRDELLELLGNLVAANTVNPPGNEVEAARVMTTFLDEAGIDHDTFEFVPERPNVIATLGKGKPALALVGHFDVVPPGDGWRTDPFEMVVKNGRAYGRGVIDNKGPLAACLMLMKRLKESGETLGGKLIVVGCSDEEQGSGEGMVKLVRKGKLKADAAIIPDCAGRMRKLIVAEKGLFQAEVIATGRQAHASTPEDGVSAIEGMSAFIEAVKSHKFRRTGGRFLKGTTYNIGTIAGGVARNVVPAGCRAGLDIRFLPGDTAKSIESTLKEIARGVKKRYPKLKLKINVTASMEPFSLDPKLPIVRLIRKHAGERLGSQPELSGLGGTTVAKQCLEKGIVAVGFAPGGPGAHTANESISVKELEDFVTIMDGVVREYLAS